MKRVIWVTKWITYIISAILIGNILRHYEENFFKYTLLLIIALIGATIIYTLSILEKKYERGRT